MELTDRGKSFISYIKINSKRLDIDAFYFTGDDYRYKIAPDSKKKFMNLITDKINSSTDYKNKRYKWDTLILTKSQELTHFIQYKTKNLDFVKPSPNIYYM
ncbi:MAG: hypothetical protein NWF08_00895 [Candidatus Bathyarchaeota archaeon]|nr:hypothetical protein [Candidatus Bathyarchaeota archaeon]